MAITGLKMDFNRYKPKQTYTFTVSIERHGHDALPSDDKSRLSAAVSSITMPTIQIQQIQDTEFNFGLYWNMYTVHDIDSKELTITFEETDDMLVTRTFFPYLTNMGNRSLNLWNDAQFNITVTHFNEYKYDSAKETTQQLTAEYLAIVKDFKHPSLSRTGNVDKLDIEVTFHVLSKDFKDKYSQQISKHRAILSSLFHGKKFEETTWIPSMEDFGITDNDPNPSQYFDWHYEKKDFNNIYKRIREKYKEWLQANKKANDYDNMQNFLQNVLTAKDVGNGGNKHIFESYKDGVNGMCARGTALQLALLFDKENYQQIGNGATAVTSEMFKQAYGAKTSRQENLEKIWEKGNDTVKTLEDKLARKLKEDPNGTYVISFNYEGSNNGHVFTYKNGKSVSDYKQNTLFGMGSRKHDRKITSVSIVKVSNG